MKVFISHSSADKKFVRTLKSDLNENGIDTFVDEDSLDYGDSLRERLEEAIKESSHFIIILTNNAVKSEWVKDELNEAIRLFNRKTLDKIIPIKYRECQIPHSIEGLIYADLSAETVQVDKDKVIFLGSGYSMFLQKLIKTIRSSQKRLNVTDINNIIAETKESEKNHHKHPVKEFITRHKIIGFKNKSTLSNYYAKILAYSAHKNLSSLYPIVLPTIYKVIFVNLEYGDEIKFTIDNITFKSGHFAGFRTTSEPGIVMQIEMRKFLFVESGKVYNFSIDIEKKIFQRL
jgi:hypothetical protein